MSGFFFPSTWPEAAASLVVVSGVCGFAFLLIRSRLQIDFSTKADKGDIHTLSVRLSAVEDRLNAAPTHDDFRHLAGRVSSVERQVDVVGADVRGVVKGIERLERMTELLVKHHMPAGKDLA